MRCAEREKRRDSSERQEDDGGARWRAGKQNGAPPPQPRVDDRHRYSARGNHVTKPNGTRRLCQISHLSTVPLTAVIDAGHILASSSAG
jgi:hypothetical protein